MGPGLPNLSKYRTWLVVLGLVLLLVASQRSGIVARQQANCEAINEVKATLVTYVDQQIDRSSKSLPTIEYYKNHPVELGRALANLERQRQATHEAFAPSSC